MPTYSFKCPECGYVSEQQLSITELDFAITLCPVCALSDKPQQVIMRRLFPVPGIILKGGGWASKS